MDSVCTCDGVAGGLYTLLRSGAWVQGAIRPTGAQDQPRTKFPCLLKLLPPAPLSLRPPHSGTVSDFSREAGQQSPPGSVFILSFYPTCDSCDLPAIKMWSVLPHRDPSCGPGPCWPSLPFLTPGNQCCLFSTSIILSFQERQVGGITQHTGLDLPPSKWP